MQINKKNYNLFHHSEVQTLVLRGGSSEESDVLDLDDGGGFTSEAEQAEEKVVYTIRKPHSQNENKTKTTKKTEVTSTTTSTVSTAVKKTSTASTSVEKNSVAPLVSDKPKPADSIETPTKRAPAIVPSFSRGSKIDLYKEAIKTRGFKRSASLADKTSAKRTYDPKRYAKAPSVTDSESKTSAKTALPEIFGIKRLEPKPYVKSPVLPVPPPTIIEHYHVPVHQRLGQRAVESTITSGAFERSVERNLKLPTEIIIRHIHEYKPAQDLDQTSKNTTVEGVSPVVEKKLSRGARRRRNKFAKKLKEGELKDVSTEEIVKRFSKN